MAKTIYKKKIKNGREYYFFRLRHKNLRKPKDIYAPTVKELEEKIKNISKDLDNNIKDTREYFDTAFTEWLFNIHFIKLKETSQNTYESIYRVHIKKCELSDIKINELCAADIQRYYNNLIKKGATAYTVRQIHRLINPFIRYLYDNDIIIKDFTRAIQLPKENEKTKMEKADKINPFTLEEQKKFVQIIKGHIYEVLFLTALYSGLRRGEILALTWDDINFDECYIDVNKTTSRVKSVSEEGRGESRAIVQTPKTKGSIRKVNIPVSLVNILRKYKIKQAETILKSNGRYENNNLVFTNRRGRYLSPSHVVGKLKEVLADNGMESRRFHDLRHTYATRLFELGESPKKVQTLLGHSNISITLNTYTHVLDDEKGKTVSKLEILFNEIEGDK